MIEIIGIFNSISETTIPIENFIRLDENNFEKNIIVINTSLEDSKKCILKKGNFPEIPIHSLKKYKLKSINLNFYYKLNSLIKSINPDIVHVHHTISAFATLSLKNIFANSKTKFILTMHNDFRFYNYYQKLIFSFCIKNADHIIANSNNTKLKIKHILKEDNCTVIYNGVSQKDILNKKRKINKKVVLGIVGRLVKQKDHKTLIKSMKILTHKLKNNSPHLQIVGDGYLDNEIREQIYDSKLEKNISMLGSLNRNDVYKMLHEIDIFVVSSKFEGFCNAMVEAMMAGCMIVSTNIQPLPEVLGGKNNGILYKVGDYKTLANKLETLCNSREKIDSYSDKSSTYAKKNYSMRRCVNEHAILYKSIIHDR